MSKPPAGGTHHAHLPKASPQASTRDRAVWDVLSDQPHQHASKWQKTRIRLADAPSHIRDYVSVAASLPSVWRRFSQIRQGLYCKPVVMGGIGLAVRPLAEDPDAHLEAILETGVRHVLLRLHPWDESHEEEERLAAALAENGIDLAVSLPQNRELVRDLPRWRAAVEELGDRFSRYSTDFVIGHAVNRSKWGVWTSAEYVRLFREAEDVLRRVAGRSHPRSGSDRLRVPVDVGVPSALRPQFRRHREPALRRPSWGARKPAARARHGRQDDALEGKVCDTCGRSKTPSWITEVNWPLWEGPHSPAGRAVSVDEQAQADYLTRYYLLGLGSGLVDRIYWWRLVARGYGLTTIEPDGRIRRRPSFDALRTLVRELDGAQSIGPAPAAEGVFVHQFEKGDARIVAAWSLEAGVEARLPFTPISGTDRDGRSLKVNPGPDVVLGPSPVFYRTE